MIAILKKLPSLTCIIKSITLSLALALMIEGCFATLDMANSGLLYFEGQPLIRMLILFVVIVPIAFYFVARRERQNKEYALLNNINTCILIINSKGKILFYNSGFISIFNKISTWLPIKELSSLASCNYFDFYLNPEEQRKLFQNKKNFPLTSVLDIGSEIISAYVSPIYKDSNLFSKDIESHDKFVVTWELITRERNQKRWEKVVEEQIENTSGELTAASRELMSSSHKVKEIAQDTSRQAQDVASFSREVTELILKLSEAVDMSSSKIMVIAQSVQNSRKISETALAESRSTRMLITDLSLMASSISKTTQTIQEIMAQTHVLALNANIEAVKAGSAGRGFAVIAKEVSNLAKQTANMSEEITNVVDQILSKIPQSVSSIETVEEVVRKMNSITLSINDLMVEQTSLMGTMNENMNEANQNSDQITNRMDEVVSHSYSTLDEIEKSQNAGKNIESIAELFNLIVSRFGEERIVTPNDIYQMLSTTQQLIDAWIEISFPHQIWEQVSKIPLEKFEGKKPANVLKTSINNYQIMLKLSSLPAEDILFPKGTVTPTQTYNFLSQMLELVDKILTEKVHQTRVNLDIHKLKIARPVTGKTPSDAYAIAHKINRKLEIITKTLPSFI